MQMKPVQLHPHLTSQENDELEQRSKSLTKELKLLKEIFVKQMNQQGGQEEEEG